MLRPRAMALVCAISTAATWAIRSTSSNAPWLHAMFALVFLGFAIAVLDGDRLMLLRLTGVLAIALGAASGLVTIFPPMAVVGVASFLTRDAGVHLAKPEPAPAPSRTTLVWSLVGLVTIAFVVAFAITVMARDSRLVPIISPLVLGGAAVVVIGIRAVNESDMRLLRAAGVGGVLLALVYAFPFGPLLAPAAAALVLPLERQRRRAGRRGFA